MASALALSTARIDCAIFVASGDTSGSATVNAEPALIVIAAIVPDVYGDTPSPVYFPTVGPAPLAVDADDDEALLLTLLLT